ncbi:hypothetical protein DRN43_00655 [Thermococci archaeon]|nr:MAG: hypothetical protein DRN43_00655 [Thermococci archaeon]
MSSWGRTIKEIKILLASIGVEFEDLEKAIKLIRDTEQEALMQFIDPKAWRIAKKMALLADSYIAKAFITKQEEAVIDAIAIKLVKGTVKEWKLRYESKEREG